MCSDVSLDSSGVHSMFVQVWYALMHMNCVTTESWTSLPQNKPANYEIRMVVEVAGSSVTKETES